MEMKYVEHEYIKKNQIEYREYQFASMKHAVNENTLVVLPTGTGKTAIALLTSAEWLKKERDCKIVFLAPTKPLVFQHEKYFSENLNINPLHIKALSGEIPPEKRRELWTGQIILATPQVVYNDLIKKYVAPRDNWLFIFDEAHRAVKDHSYVKVARIITENRRPRILALTASPGDVDKTKEIMRNLYIERLIVLTRSDEQLKKYLQPIKTAILDVDPPPSLKYALSLIEEAINKRLDKLGELIKDQRSGFKLSFKTISFTKLDNIRNKIEELYMEGGIEREKRKHIKLIISQLIYLDKLLGYLETYSYKLFLRYYEELRRKATRRRVTVEKILMNDNNLKEAYLLIESLYEKGHKHPKIIRLVNFLKENKEKTLVFVGMKEVTMEIIEMLRENNIQSTYLIGQLRNKGELGMRQREQIGALNQFRKGTYRVLVATHIGEEGLDISEVNNVIFYDNPISAIRRIQREGRTGRTQPGRIYFLFLKGTRDEARYWIGRKMERKLIEQLKALKPTFISIEKGIKPLSEFISKKKEEAKKSELAKVIVDYRERSGKIVEYLRERGVDIELKELPVGDYMVGRYLIERKTMLDLAQSIIDGRVFQQLKELKRQNAEIVLIIEGKTIDFTKRLDERVLAGILISIIEDYKVPIYRTATDRESAEIIYTLLQRQIVERKEYHRIRLERKPLEIYEIQKFLLAGIPGIDSVLADKLLTKFGTLEKLAKASLKELVKVEGIGENLAKRIYNVFHETYPKSQRNKLSF
jgi:Fanconi anemia group M protein